MRTCPALQALVAAERDLICRTLHSQTSMRALVISSLILPILGISPMRREQIVF